MPLDPQTLPEGSIAQGRNKYLDVVLYSALANPPVQHSYTSTALAQAFEYNTVNPERDETSDWSNLRLRPVLSQYGSTRILMRPRIEGVHIGPYQTRQPFGHWAEVEMEGSPKPAAVFIIEPDHLHIACVVSHNDSMCHLFLDPGHDHLHLRNRSPRALFAKQLDGESSYWVLPGERVTLSVGLWALCKDHESFIEFQVLKRKAWITTQPMSSSDGAQSHGNLSNTPNLSSGIGAIQTQEAVIVRDTQDSNALIELRKGEKIYIGMSKVYWLKRLDTIYDHRNSSVWQAEHRKRGGVRKIVVKVIKPEAFGGDAVLAAEAWKKECEAHVIVTQPSHPSIVDILGFDARFHSIYIEHISATSLANQRQHSLFYGSRRDARKILENIASALSHVHSKRKVHNDVKPGNILYSPERGAVLVDFGLCFSHGHPTHNGSTPWYMPPEYMFDWRLCGPQSDIWALGVVMLWLLGHIPLPEISSEPWWASDIYAKQLGTTAHHAARNSMSRWIQYIQDARSRLREDDELEAIVRQTLETDVTIRIDAESICKQLGDLTLDIA